MPEKRDQSAGIYALAARCGIGMGDACDNIGLSRSTPPKWKRGQKPRDRKLIQLRKSILELSHKAGLLPADLLDEMIPQPAKTCAIVDALNKIREGCDTIEAATQGGE